MTIAPARYLLPLAFFCCLHGASAWAEEGDAKVVHAFLASWQSHDVDKILSIVSEDCYYKNVPSLGGEDGVVQGRPKMREFLAPFFRSDPLIVPFNFHTDVKFTVAGGGAVAIERVDHFDIASAHFDVPVAGIFKVKNGKITYWVDYFDGSTFEPIGTLMKSLAKK